MKTTAYVSSSEIDVRAGRRFQGACWASLLMHGAGIALLALLAWSLKDRVEEERPFVIVPDAASAGSRVVTSNDAGSSSSLPGADALPSSAKLFNPPPSVRSWTMPREPETVTSSVPVDVPSRGPTSRPPASATNSTSSSERPKPPEVRNGTPTTYREYLAQLGSRPGPKISPRDVSAEGGAPHVSVPSANTGPGNGPGAASSASANGMAGYFDGLRQRLRDSHEKPGGLSDLLNAEVQFTVAANGVISGVKIVRSSGSTEFDQSVLEAFGRVKMPARPDGKTDVQRLTFRIKEA